MEMFAGNVSCKFRTNIICKIQLTFERKSWRYFAKNNKGNNEMKGFDLLFIDPLCNGVFLNPA